MINLDASYSSIRQQIQNACQDAKRDPAEVMLLAVSKRQPISAIQTLYDAGQRDFGENQLQEARPKIQAIDVPGIVWHFIGPIQTNKTRAIAEHFDWVHTVCRLKEAERLDAQRPTSLPPLNILIQVNIGQEPQKNGLLPPDVPAFIEQLTPYTRLKLRGLMCLPPYTRDAATQCKVFSAMQTLAQTCQLDILSMGTSHDMISAIACGSTCVRIGQGLFGERQS